MTSGLGNTRLNDETKGHVGDPNELPAQSLVVKTLRAAKSKITETWSNGSANRCVPFFQQTRRSTFPVFPI